MRACRRSLLVVVFALTGVFASVTRAGSDRAAADEAFLAGRWAEAAAHLEHCTAADPRDVLAWLRLALARLELGEPDAARKALAQVALLEGPTARVGFATGRIALVTSEFETAVAAFQAVAARDPAFEPAWTTQNLGYALQRLGRQKEARAAYRTALDRPADERHARMYLNAARNELELDDLAAARDLLTRGRTAFPSDPWLADAQGWALAIAGDARGAAETYAQARALVAAPSGPPVVVGLPLAGVVRVIQGPRGAFSHESLRNVEAVDLVAVDARGRDARHTLGQPVLAALDGEVLLVRDGIADNRPGETNVREPRGNHVYLRHGPGTFTRYFHLQAGSVPWRVGDRVRRGEAIGRCGNSGFSTRPHLCFGVCAVPPEEDVSLPLAFGPCRVREKGGERAVDATAPVEGMVLAPP